MDNMIKHDILGYVCFQVFFINQKINIKKRKKRS